MTDSDGVRSADVPPQDEMEHYEYSTEGMQPADNILLLKQRQQTPLVNKDSPTSHNAKHGVQSSVVKPQPSIPSGPMTKLQQPQKITTTYSPEHHGTAVYNANRQPVHIQTQEQNSAPSYKRPGSASNNSPRSLSPRSTTIITTNEVTGGNSQNFFLNEGQQLSSSSFQQLETQLLPLTAPPNEQIHPPLNQQSGINRVEERTDTSLNFFANLQKQATYSPSHGASSSQLQQLPVAPTVAFDSADETPVTYMSHQNQINPLSHLAHNRIQENEKRASSLPPSSRIQTDSPPEPNGQLPDIESQVPVPNLIQVPVQPPLDHLTPPSGPLVRSNSDPQSNSSTVVYQQYGAELNDLLSSSGQPDSLNFFERADVKLQIKKEAGIPTMTDFKESVVKKLPTAWQNFGMQLGIAPFVLDDIERKYSGRDPQQCFIEVFRYWESQREGLLPFSWWSVAKILDHSEPILAETIKTTFLSNAQNTQPFGVPLDQQGMPSLHSNNLKFPPPPLSTGTQDSFLNIDYRPSLPYNPQPNMQRMNTPLMAPSLPTSDYSSMNSSHLNSPAIIPGVTAPFSTVSAPSFHTVSAPSFPIAPVPPSISSRQPAIIASQQLPSSSQSYSMPPQYWPYANYPPPHSAIMGHNAPHPTFHEQDEDQEFQSLPSSINERTFNSRHPSNQILQPYLPRMTPQTLHQQHPHMYLHPSTLPPQQIPPHPYNHPGTMYPYPASQYSLPIPPPANYPTAIFNNDPSALDYPLSTGTMVTAVPVATPTEGTQVYSFAKEPVVNQPLATTESVPAQEESVDSGSFYSADDAPLSTTTKSESSWIELIQKYMNVLAQKSTHPSSLRPSSPSSPRSSRPPRSSSPARQPVKPQKEEKSLLEKELEKAYERISALEVRVQDLTGQVTSEIPEDSELSMLTREKLEQDFRRMRELKKKAEQQSMDSKQAAQRTIAENFRLKEELSQVKNDRDMLILELRRHQRRSGEREQARDEQIKAIRQSLADAISEKFSQFKGQLSSPSPRTGQLFFDVSEYPSQEFTPDLMWEIIKNEKSVLTVGQVAVVGLPSCGKSSMVKALLSKENNGKVPIPKGDPTYMEVYEIMMSKNPLTGDQHWEMVSGTECAVQYLATVVAQYYFRQKQMPSFSDSAATKESFEKLFPDSADAHIKNHFKRVYKDVIALLQKEKKKDGLTQLALFQPAFLNLWDVGVNRSLYQFLPELSGRCERLVILDVLDLERDVPNLDEPPVLSNDLYKQRGDDQLVMRAYSRLEYFLLFAGLKCWFNKNPAAMKAPEVTIIGRHTKEFAERDGGEVLKETIHQLQFRINALASKMGIVNVINLNIVLFCTDGNNESKEKELSRLKQVIEKLVSVQPGYEEPFEAKWIFFRSLFYNYNHVTIPRDVLVKDARSCGILTQGKLEECLLAFRNIGSILYAPELECSFSKNQVSLDVCCILENLDRLFYLHHYESVGKLSISSERQKDVEMYDYGLITKALANEIFTKQESESYLEYLIACEVCARVTVNSEELYFMPAIRRKSRISLMNKSSLFVQYHCHYAQCDQLVVFQNYIPKIFEPQDKIDFLPSKEFNVFSFKYTNTTENLSVQIEVIYHTSIIEIHVLDDNGKDTNPLTLSLCSKLFSLCQKVYDHICSNIPDLSFDFSVMCPNSSPNEPHFINFFTNYSYSPTIFCTHCKEGITSDFTLWLMANCNE